MGSYATNAIYQIYWNIYILSMQDYEILYASILKQYFTKV